MLHTLSAPVVSFFNDYRVVIDPVKDIKLYTHEYMVALQYLQKNTSPMNWLELEQGLQITQHNITMTAWVKLPIIR